jgi:opacity protein-like surface antigen
MKFLKSIYHFNPNFGLFVEAGAGGNLRIITDMATVAKQDVVLVGETKTSIVNHYDKAFSFAWQAGIGFEVAKNLVVGCSFYDLGKGTVNMTENKKITIGENTTTSQPDYKTLGTVHPVMVLGRIGFSF